MQKGWSLDFFTLNETAPESMSNTERLSNRGQFALHNQTTSVRHAKSSSLQNIPIKSTQIISLYTAASLWKPPSTFFSRSDKAFENVPCALLHGSKVHLHRCYESVYEMFMCLWLWASPLRCHFCPSNERQSLTYSTLDQLKFIAITKGQWMPIEKYLCFNSGSKNTS